MSGDAGTCRLYLITPPKIDLGAFAHEIEAAFQGGDIACVQLRLKDASDDEIRAAAQTLMPIAHAHDAAFLINDSPELAVELGADGCHVGQEDTSYADARKIVGPDAIVGVTCHDSRHLAMEAGEAGADYVAFGAFFSTSTKTAKSEASAEILQVVVRTLRSALRRHRRHHHRQLRTTDQSRRRLPRRLKRCVGI